MNLTGTPSPAAPTQTRSGCFRWLVGLLAVAVILGAAGTYFYFKILHPPARAHLHLPSGTTIAVRADAVELLAFKPIREKLRPLLEHQDAGNAAAPALQKFLERLRVAGGVSLPSDLREIVVGSVDGVEWVAAVGGTLKAGHFVDGLESLMAEDGNRAWHRDGDVLVHTLGTAIGQADDGTLVIGTNKTLVRAALPAHEPDAGPDDLPLATNGAITFMLNSAAYRNALTRLPALFSSVDTLSKIDRLNGTFTLSQEPHIDVHLLPRGPSAPELAAALEGQLATVKLLLVFSPWDFGGARDAVKAASIRAEGTQVIVSAPWSYAALESNVDLLAGMLTVALAQNQLMK